MGVYRRKSQYEYEITNESTWQEVILGLLSTVKSQDIVVMSSGRDQSSRPNVLMQLRHYRPATKRRPSLGNCSERNRSFLVSVQIIKFNFLFAIRWLLQ